MRTEAYQALVELAAVTATGAYREWPVDAGAYPTITNGCTDYGQPVPRVTWRLGMVLGVESRPGQVTIPPFQHRSYRVRG